MEVKETNLPGLKIINPRVFADSRGYFFESFQSERYVEAGIELPFVQENISRSSKGVLRGLHYQLQHAQGKLVTVVRGEVFDVAVDIRQGSPTFGKWFGLILSDENHLQFYISPGFAHGFFVLSEYADFYYKCTDYYFPNDEYGIAWNDEDIGIEWPDEKNPLLSPKDSKYTMLREIDNDFLPSFK